VGRGAWDASLVVVGVAVVRAVVSEGKLRLVGVSENTVLLASTASTAQRMLQLCMAEMGACGEALFTKYCEREQERRQTRGKELWTV